MEENNGRAFNPLGPHALRESFGSIMINSGVPDTVVDFWLGHSIGEMAEAYKSLQAESLKEMYLQRENLISVNPQTDVKEIEAKLKGEMEQQNRQLQTLVNNLATENTDLRHRIQMAERKLGELEKLVKETLES